jgi:hypothetical protein
MATEGFQGSHDLLPLESHASASGMDFARGCINQGHGFFYCKSFAITPAKFYPVRSDGYSDAYHRQHG